MLTFWNAVRTTPEAQRETRQRILAAAARLFAQAGFGPTGTREVARAADIAAGTLFNYFPTKEALGLALLGEGLAAAGEELERASPAPETLEEALFLQVALQLRHLRAFRAWVVEILAPAWSPLAGARGDEASDFRRRHLERAAALLAAHGLAATTDADELVDLHLYWALYLGVLGFWARDESEHQEATLALLDRAIGLFCRGLRERANPEPRS